MSNINRCQWSANACNSLLFAYIYIYICTSIRIVLCGEKVSNERRFACRQTTHHTTPYTITQIGSENLCTFSYDTFTVLCSVYKQKKESQTLVKSSHNLVCLCVCVVCAVWICLLHVCSTDSRMQCIKSS